MSRLLQLFQVPDLDGNQAAAISAIQANYLAFARGLAANLPGGPETTVALRKLLESRDAAMNAVAFLQGESPNEQRVKIVGGGH